MLIKGIIASAITGSKLSSYESIATVTVGAGGASVISFTSIPSTYKHLQLRFTHRSTGSTSTDVILFTVNNDYGGTQYAFHALRGNGSTASAYGIGSYGRYEIGQNAPYSSTTAGIFDVGIIDILDYASTNKNKTMRTLWGFDANGSGWVELSSSVYLNTNAINRMDLYDAYGNWAQYSSIALYGVKG